MNTARQERPDAARTAEAFASQYQSVFEGWAEVSKCCLEAADDIYQTGMEYMKDQSEHMREIAFDPAAAMREETYSNAINSSIDAADRIAQAYLRSLETVREPLMRVVSAQLPISRTMAGAMESSMERGLETISRGAERMEKTLRGTAAQAAEEARRRTHQAKRRSA